MLVPDIDKPVIEQFLLHNPMDPSEAYSVAIPTYRA